MEGMQIFSYGLMAALIIMAFVFVLLPIPPVRDLEKYAVSVKLMALSYLSLGVYCFMRIPFPIDLLGAPFLFTSIFQTHLLALSFINMMNADYVKRGYVVTMLSPVFLLFAVFLATTVLDGYHSATTYADLYRLAFEELRADVLVRICAVIYYVALAGYYLEVFFKERAKQKQRLEQMTIDVELHAEGLHRLYVGNCIGLSVCAITYVVLFTTSTEVRSSCTTAILSLYMVVGLIVVRYPKIYLSSFDAVKDDDDDTADGSAEERAEAWKFMRARIVEEGLYKQPGVTVSRLAECFNVPRGVLSSSINQCEGVNFNTFIKNLRVDTAKKMMEADPSRTMVEVMTAVGYTDQANFSRHFKQVVGIPPAEWKKNNCQAKDAEN